MPSNPSFRHRRVNGPTAAYAPQALTGGLASGEMYRRRLQFIAAHHNANEPNVNIATSTANVVVPTNT